MSNPFYTLTPPKNYSLRLFYKHKRMRPQKSLRIALTATGLTEYAVKKRAKLIDFPSELTFRELAFVAKGIDMDVFDLIEGISEGVDLKEKNECKTKLSIEKLKHGETRKRIGQIGHELQAAGKQIAKLRNTLHEKQDPTIQAGKGRGNS